jgi:glycosyltransferase involved in cell wall biosynthesis
MLSNIVPYPPHGGVHLRILNIAQRIAARHEVTLGCHSWGEEDLEGAAWLNRNGIRTITAPLRAANWRHAPSALGALLAGEPPEIVQYQSAGLHALVANERFDLIQVEETLLTPYVTAAPPLPDTKTVLTFHNLHFVQEKRIAAIEPNRGVRLWRELNARRMRRYEPAVAARFDRTVTVTEAERTLLLDHAPDLTVDVLPNGVDTQALRPLPAPSGKPAIVFVGTLSYLPCADAALWLARTILPLARRRFPDLELWIVGRQPPPQVLALAGEGVFVTGAVDDVAPYYERAAVAVVPLQAGGGSRLKILEAMSLGRPVVSTRLGAEGIEATPDKHILLADDAQGFADAIGRLLVDQALSDAIVRDARQFVEDHHDWDAIAAKQLAIYDDLLRPS